MNIDINNKIFSCSFSSSNAYIKRYDNTKYSFKDIIEKYYDRNIEFDVYKTIIKPDKYVVSIEIYKEDTEHYPYQYLYESSSSTKVSIEYLNLLLAKIKRNYKIEKLLDIC